MNLETLRTFFMWCSVINYAVLLVWFLAFISMHDWMFRFHGRWFRFTQDRFDTIHYAAMAAFKTGILLFNLVPFLALCIMM